MLAVLAYHGGLTWAPGGFLGVEVFFVISGYLITALLVSEHTRGTIALGRSGCGGPGGSSLPCSRCWSSVTRRRAVVAPDGSDASAATSRPRRLREQLVLIVRDDSYFAQAGRPPLLAAPVVAGGRGAVLPGHGPILALLLPPTPPSGAIALLAIGGAVASALAMAALYNPDSDPSNLYSPPTCGCRACSSAWRWRSSGRRPSCAAAGRRAAPSASWAMDGVGLAGMLVLVWAFWRINEFDAFVYRGGFVVVDLATLAIIAALVHSSSHLERFLGVAPLVWLGQRSYGIYLWHWPIFQLTRPGIDLQWPPLAITVLRVGLTLGAAAASYRWIEQPIRHGALSRRWAEHPSRRRTDANAAIGAGLTIAMILALGPVVRPDHSVDELPARRPRRRGERRALARGPRRIDRAHHDHHRPHHDAGAGDDARTAHRRRRPRRRDGRRPPLPAPTTTVPAPTTTLVPRGIRVTAIGDSVMLDAKRLMQQQIPQIAVDAKVSRQFGEAGPQAMRLAASVPSARSSSCTSARTGRCRRASSTASSRRSGRIAGSCWSPPMSPARGRRSPTSGSREAPGRWSNVTVADWNALVGAASRLVRARRHPPPAARRDRLHGPHPDQRAVTSDIELTHELQSARRRPAPRGRGRRRRAVGRAAPAAGGSARHRQVDPAARRRRGIGLGLRVRRGQRRAHPRPAGRPLRPAAGARRRLLARHVPRRPADQRMRDGACSTSRRSTASPRRRSTCSSR